MRLNKHPLRRVLEIAAEKAESGFEEKDILPPTTGQKNVSQAI